MASTFTFVETLRDALNKADPNRIADALRKAAIGTRMSSVKVTFSGLTSAAAQDITTAAALSHATLAGLVLGENETLPPIASILSLRVTAGAATAGARVVTDAGGAASAPGMTGPGIALISDDGKTLTFEGTVTGFVLEYTPRPADLTQVFTPET